MRPSLLSTEETGSRPLNPNSAIWTNTGGSPKLRHASSFHHLGLQKEDRPGQQSHQIQGSALRPWFPSEGRARLY
ncbi:hypothetical protein MJO28_008338 [Puccinia striiformis f. sp. tritici]|uniref:Uncharacterized protein n=1 Tax=Puccinia striiformis f. sp. tritici TaxID=168172 RepID=A0ACC0EA86_9BASI|nr:hypothetical protein MJO28_008338 [Puccinia striiformis f. sp. tritici]